MNALESPAARQIVILLGSLSAGGAERVAATLGNAWSRQGRAVWIVSTYLGSQEPAYRLDAAVRTVFLSDVLSGRRARWHSLPSKLCALRQVVRGIAPDVVVSFLTNVNVLAIAALAGLRVPLIVSERVYPSAKLDVPWMLRLGRLLSYPLADALVAQTPAAAERYAAQLPLVKRVEVVPNPLPRELSTSAVRSQHDGRGGCVIAMGRLTRQKGFDRLIKAFAQALGEDPSWSLHIWGEGPLRTELARLIAELHLTNRVHLEGATNRPWEALAGAQIFVLSSEYEGFPNAMLEAMAVGLPCVAFDCPSGPRELSDEGLAALMVAPGDVSGLADAIRELALARDARRGLGARAAAFVRSKFSEEAVLGEWDRVFDLVTAARRQDR